MRAWAVLAASAWPWACPRATGADPGATPPGVATTGAPGRDAGRQLFAELRAMMGDTNPFERGGWSGVIVADDAGLSDAVQVGAVLPTGLCGGGTGEGTIGMGQVGTLGVGTGISYGQPGLRHARASRGQRATPSVPTVAGLLSPVAIRRVVVRNISEVQRCYEQGLIASPMAGGRVAVRFVIGSDGGVLSSFASESTPDLSSVSQCMANAVRRWRFPAPEGEGQVTVTYPFDLRPAVESLLAMGLPAFREQAVARLMSSFAWTVAPKILRSPLKNSPVPQLRASQTSQASTEQFTVAGVSHRLRWIAPGSFKMGSPETEADRYSDEGPQHTVTLSRG